jgi:hypothetical protein
MVFDRVRPQMQMTVCDYNALPGKGNRVRGHILTRLESTFKQAYIASGPGVSTPVSAR